MGLMRRIGLMGLMNELFYGSFCVGRFVGSGNRLCLRHRRVAIDDPWCTRWQKPATQCVILLCVPCVPNFLTCVPCVPTFFIYFERARLESKNLNANWRKKSPRAYAPVSPGLSFSSETIPLERLFSNDLCDQTTFQSVVGNPCAKGAKLRF